MSITLKVFLLALGLVALALFIVAPAEPVEAIHMPCNYCRFCGYCEKCGNCPCDPKTSDPTCVYCKYCTYCPLCRLCDTMCAEGGIGHLFGDALQWVQNKASDLLGVVDPKSIDLDAIDRDLFELPTLLKQ